LLDRALVTIAETETIEEAFRRLNANMLGILLALDANGRVVEVVTDGDVRRKLLRVTIRQQVVLPFVCAAYPVHGCVVTLVYHYALEKCFRSMSLKLSIPLCRLRSK
jgi:CBS-domain-containing membrane protein